eukprot:831191-Amorphochlora_amoeboformis.AAC.1
MAGTSWRMRRLALWGMGMWPMRADLAQLATALYGHRDSLIPLFTLTKGGLLEVRRGEERRVENCTKGVDEY